MAVISTGVTALRKIQLGLESTAGTAVPATTIWRGMGSFEDMREVVNVEEDIGIAIQTTRAYIPKLGAKIVLDPIEATFQQLPHIFECGVAEETPTQDGAGTGYIYAYAHPTTAMQALATYTGEVGDNIQAREVEYLFAESYKISGNAAEGVMMEASLIGRQPTDTTFTPALTVPTLLAGDHIVFGGSTLAIDAVGGTIGATVISNTLLSFELDVTTGYAAKYTNAAKYFDFVYFDKGAFSATLKLVYEHNAAAETQKGLYEAATPRLFRLEFTGNALGTPATENNLSYRIDCAGIYTEMPDGEQDGNVTKEATVQIGYDLTAALGLEHRIVNELVTLP